MLEYASQFKGIFQSFTQLLRVFKKVQIKLNLMLFQFFLKTALLLFLFLFLFFVFCFCFRLNKHRHEMSTFRIECCELIFMLKCHMLFVLTVRNNANRAWLLNMSLTLTVSMFLVHIIYITYVGILS